MFGLELVKELNSGSLVDVDFSLSGKLAILTSEREVCSLSVGSETWFSWNKNEMPHMRHARWMADDRLAVWSLPTKIGFTDGVLACSPSERAVIPVGLPKDILFGREVYFVCFGEDQFLRASGTDLESNMIAAFDNKNRLLFGLREIVNDRNAADSPTEMRIGCVTQEDEAIFALSGSDVLWRVNARRKLVTRIAIAERPYKLVAISELNEVLAFVLAEPSKFQFGRIILKDGSMVTDGEIAYSELDQRDPLNSYNSRRVRVHGCSNGRIAISTKNTVWSASWR